MYDKYLVTGATGFLGRAVVEAAGTPQAHECMRLCCMMTPISICSPKKSIPSSVMCMRKTR